MWIPSTVVAFLALTLTRGLPTSTIPPKSLEVAGKVVLKFDPSPGDIDIDHTWRLMVEASDNMPKRITPKSVFIVPALANQVNVCPNGWRFDHRGRCLKPQPVDPSTSYDLILKRLNRINQLMQQNSSSAAASSSSSSSGPLKLNLDTKLNSNTEATTNTATVTASTATATAATTIAAATAAAPAAAPAVSPPPPTTTTTTTTITTTTITVTPLPTTQTTPEDGTSAGIFTENITTAAASASAEFIDERSTEVFPTSSSVETTTPYQDTTTELTETTKYDEDLKLTDVIKTDAPTSPIDIIDDETESTTQSNRIRFPEESGSGSNGFRFPEDEPVYWWYPNWEISKDQQDILLRLFSRISSIQSNLR